MLTLNININEKLRQEFTELLTLNSLKNRPIKQNLEVSEVPQKSYLHNGSNKVPEYPINEQFSPEIQSRNSNLLEFQEIGLQFDPDEEPMQGKPIYNLEMPVYQSEQNKEMFLK